ncbi:glucose-1-phosphate cytidylyltransferase [Limnospira platensis]|uniref:glucose-1-phosphate cytidylyltransferase n=1 Tax=Limnospira platensis TaxID=118562 RepID=UPI0002803DF2|nr:glucose-1-phosphate cytidylyltransferase [Arthrospira platensis C1]UWU51550.1 glucose-1-phosphate cytidylyltransferase [Arthrospira platensis C1]
MKVVILAGGMGTRLREETEYRPKPLVEVGGKPIIWHIMKLYAHYGFLDFIVCLGYKGNLIKEYFLNYEAMNNDFTISLGRSHQITYHNTHSETNFSVTLVNTGLDTLTGGRVAQVKPYINEDLFMVTYGDGLADLNIKDLVDFHKNHGKIATVTTVQPLSRYGVVNVDKEARVLNFGEKIREDKMVSAGFFVFDRRIFDYLWDGDCVLEKEPLEKLAAAGQLMSYHHESFFYAMDTFKDYQELNVRWNSGQTPWKVWE